MEERLTEDTRGSISLSLKSQSWGLAVGYSGVMGPYPCQLALLLSILSGLAAVRQDWAGFCSDSVETFYARMQCLNVT